MKTLILLIGCLFFCATLSWGQNNPTQKDTDESHQRIYDHYNVFQPGEIYPPINDSSKYDSVRFYNKYSKIVFKSTNIALGWDGYLDGKPAPDGIYYFLKFVTIINQGKKEVKEIDDAVWLITMVKLNR